MLYIYWKPNAEKRNRFSFCEITQVYDSFLLQKYTTYLRHIYLLLTASHIKSINLPFYINSLLCFLNFCCLQDMKTLKKHITFYVVSFYSLFLYCVHKMCILLNIAHGHFSLSYLASFLCLLSQMKPRYPILSAQRYTL